MKISTLKAISYGAAILGTAALIGAGVVSFVLTAKVAAIALGIFALVSFAVAIGALIKKQCMISPLIKKDTNVKGMENLNDIELNK